MIAQENYFNVCVERIATNKKLNKEALNQKIIDFKKSVSECDDHYQMLQALVDHINEFTNASSTYIGSLQKPIKGLKQGLTEDEEEDSHIIPDAEDEL